MVTGCFERVGMTSKGGEGVRRLRGGSAVIGLALMAVCAAAGAVMALECKPKTARYFKELDNVPRTPVPVTFNGIAASLTGALGDPQKGRTVMISANKGNCIACHRVAALSSEPSHGDLGPTLNAVGARYNEAQLRQLVINPRVFYQNTIMPAYHVKEGLDRVPAAFTGQTLLTAAEVEDVVAFLKTLR
jgi:sulfur-oxidizing protein SoxX